MVQLPLLSLLLNEGAFYRYQIDTATSALRAHQKEDIGFYVLHIF